MSPFLAGLCQAIAASTGLTCSIKSDLTSVPGDMAQQLAIAINEFAINAAKHAYDGKPGHQYGEDPLRPVLEARDCQGGFTGLFGLSGNAWEWEDACGLPQGAADTCILRGGSSTTESAADLRCDHYGYNRRDFAASDFGFRCCGEVR